MKVRRVTGAGIWMVACLTLACLGFIISGLIQYVDATHVCSADETLRGNACVSLMGDGSTLSLDMSSQISDDHIGGLVLMVVGLLGFTFGLATAFRMWNFVSDQKIEREEREAAALAVAETE